MTRTPHSSRQMPKSRWCKMTGIQGRSNGSGSCCADHRVLMELDEQLPMEGCSGHDWTKLQSAADTRPGQQQYRRCQEQRKVEAVLHFHKSSSVAIQTQAQMQIQMQAKCLEVFLIPNKGSLQRASRRSFKTDNMSDLILFGPQFWR